MARPSISAIITAHNSGRYIADAIASIRGQSLPPDEIIVIDDGSTDDTATIVAGLGDDIRYAPGADRGEAASRNRGIAEARCDLIGFLDADDAWTADRTERLLHMLTDDVDIVCGRGRSFRECSWIEAAQAGEGLPEAHMMSFGASLIRRSTFARTGEIDATVDLGWFLRCREADVPIKVIDDIVLLYRRHDGNLTNNIATSRDRIMQTVKLSLERRRRDRRTTTAQLQPWETLGRREP